MKRVNSICMVFAVLLISACSTNDWPMGNGGEDSADKSSEGTLDVAIHLGKIGVLAKMGDIELMNLRIEIIIIYLIGFMNV